MVTPEQSQEQRDKAEETLAKAVDRAVATFVSRVAREALSALDGPLLASADPVAPLPDPSGQPLTLGEMSGWWVEQVDGEILAAVSVVWKDAYAEFFDGMVRSSSLQAVPEYVATVRDRLVQGLNPPVYADSFDRIREALATSTALGWSRDELAEHLAEELSWSSPDKGYWQQLKADVDLKLEAALDVYGPPGTPAREAAKHRADLAPLYELRNSAIAKMDADRSYWETRAITIARTESTGATNHAALRALADEGQSEKKWVATHDRRTRPSHAEAHGQRVATASPFSVGGYNLMMPGDPTAPASEVVSCRCTLVGGSL